MKSEIDDMFVRLDVMGLYILIVCYVQPSAFEMIIIAKSVEVGNNSHDD